MEEQKINLGVAGGAEVKEEEGEVEEGFESFEPTEDELVLHFLRPQLRGFASLGAAGAARPAGRGHGYFFAARRRGKGGKARRTPEGGGGGGAWMHSGSKEDGRSVTELGVVARWSMTRYCFFARDRARQVRRSTGWAMFEYEITDPRCYRRADDGVEDHYWVLCHVRRSRMPVPRSWKSWDLRRFSEHGS